MQKTVSPKLSDVSFIACIWRFIWRFKHSQLGSNQCCKLATAPPQHHVLQATPLPLCTDGLDSYHLGKIGGHPQYWFQPFPTSVCTICLYIFRRLQLSWVVQYLRSIAHCRRFVLILMIYTTISWRQLILYSPFCGVRLAYSSCKQCLFLTRTV